VTRPKPPAVLVRGGACAADVSGMSICQFFDSGCRIGRGGVMDATELRLRVLVVSQQRQIAEMQLQMLVRDLAVAEGLPAGSEFDVGTQQFVAPKEPNDE
jgi:hypothetical protein